MTTTTTTNSPTPGLAGARPDPAAVTRAVVRRSFCTLATTSAAGRPHVAGVLYEAVAGRLYVNTLRTSRKARNIEVNRHVGVVVPIRRMPVGPPSTVQFQGRAEILAVDTSEIVELLDSGHLASLTGHGELDLPGGCFLRITPPATVHTYGLGMSLWRLIRDPLSAGGTTGLLDW